MTATPYPYSLPHPADRAGQSDAIEWCIALRGLGIIQAPTGSGKTSFAAATSSRQRVIATCATKNLQRDNYGNSYAFDVLFGKSNYPCAYPDSLSLSPQDCQYSNKLHKCPKRSTCPYQIQKHLCQHSDRVSLNNAYYLSAMWPKDDPPTTLFLDEGHELHEFVTRWAGCTVTDKERIEWSLPDFPTITHLVANTLLRLPPPTDLALPWVIRAHSKMQSHYISVKAAATTDAGRKRLRRCENLGRKLAATLSALRSHRTDWYVRSGVDAREYRGRTEPGFVCKPLTARHHFADYFLSGAKNVIMMSATIGNFAAFADELGLAADDYSPLIIPSQYPPESQPIELLDVGAMGAKADEATLQHQAEQIANFINDCPPEWCGLVLTTSKYRTKDLIQRLAALGLEDRVWITPGADGTYSPTDHQALAWEQRKARVPNSICVTWSFWTGFDGLDEKFLVITKTPYLQMGTPESYERAWMEYSRTRYNWATGCRLGQGLGRIRRGRAVDYNLDGRVSKRVAIADSSWSRVQKYLPEITLESVVRE